MLSFTTVFAISNEQTIFSSNIVLKIGTINVAKLLVENKDVKPHTYKLSFTNIPAEMTGSYSLLAKTITEISLKAGESSIVDFNLDVPSTAAQEKVTIELSALRDDNMSTATSISFVKATDYALKIANTVNKIEGLSGENISFNVAVTNTGELPLENLNLSVDVPYKWFVTSITPENLTLKSNESVAYKLSIAVPPSQASGISNINIYCSNKNAKSDVLIIPVKVVANANFAWLFIGGAILVLAVALLFFRKYGRR